MKQRIPKASYGKEFREQAAKQVTEERLSAKEAARRLSLPPLILANRVTIWQTGKLGLLTTYLSFDDAERARERTLERIISAAVRRRFLGEYLISVENIPARIFQDAGQQPMRALVSRDIAWIGLVMVFMEQLGLRQFMQRWSIKQCARACPVFCARRPASNQNLALICVNVSPKAIIGIGGSSLTAPLPHHPACGSAPGGSRS